MGRPRKPTPEKYCPECGVKIERKLEKDGDLMSLLHFNKMKYCSRKCRDSARRGIWKIAKRLHSGRFRARHTIEAKQCERCGKIGIKNETSGHWNLDIHHKDGNPLNNSLENLEVLCRSCHEKHHRGKKNK